MNKTNFTQFPTEQSISSESMTFPANKYCLIDVDQIELNPDQPRITYSAEALEALILSIQQMDLLQPITVQKIDDRYQIITGERRWRAHLKMGKQKIEAIVKHVDDKTNAIHALAENIAREDLSDYEIGKAIRKIEVNFHNKTELANIIGINRTDMYRFLAFDSLPDFILNDLDTNPKLLSRFAADQIKKLLAHYQSSDTVCSLLETAWNLLKDEKLQQTKITAYVKNKLKEVYGLNQSATDNVLMNKNGSQIGRINQTVNYWTIQLSVHEINEHQQQQILDFIQKLFGDP